MSKTFSGVSCVMYTYLTEDGGIDTNAIAALTEAQIQAGVNNIMVLGSAGEWAYLSKEEKRQVILATVQAAKGRVPVIAGVSAFGTDNAIENAKSAEDLGCDGAISILPVNLALTPSDIIRHYEKLAAGTKLPILYYHYPECAHYDLTPEQYAEILSIDGIAGTKNSKIDMRYFQKLMRCLKEKNISKTILVGNALSLVDTMRAGGDGAMCIHVSHWPEKVVEIYKNCAEGRWDDAKKAQIELSVLMGLYGLPAMSGKAYFGLWKMLSSGYFNSLTKSKVCKNGMYKEAVRQLGFSVTPIVKEPLASLTSGQKETVTRVLSRAGLL